MRAWTGVIGVVLAIAVLSTDASAEAEWTYRARVSFETERARTNRSSPLVPAGAGAWDATNLFVATADSSWESERRVKVAGGIVATGSSDSGVSLQAREAYARISLVSWMDVEAGKRLVRWGVGYGFSPTGVLDPPRLATDPADRLGRNEGMALVRADLFRGDTALTIAVAAPTLWRDGIDGPSRMVAARVRTVLPGGLEVAIVGSAAPDARVAAGANVTHVVGQRLEWHAEVLAHDSPGVTTPGGDRGRAVSAVAGFQYTLPGVNVVMEYHRQKMAPRPGTPGGNLMFIRAARAGADVKVAPELIVIRALDDGTWTTVAGVGWFLRQRLEVYGRAMHLAGPRSSRAGLSPVSGTLSLGATVGF